LGIEHNHRPNRQPTAVMKNLPGIILVAAPTGLAVLAVASSLGVPMPSADIATRFVAVSVAAGMLATFLMDYAAPSSAARNSTLDAIASSPAPAPTAPGAASPRSAERRSKPPARGVLAALGLGNDRATVTLH
jgi:hypothetical protein